MPEEMKTLANCNPIEFLSQTGRIKKQIEKYFNDTKVIEILRAPISGQIEKELEEVTKGLDRKEHAHQIAAAVQTAKRKQTLQNISKALDVCLIDKPRETAELLGLVCFIEPEDIDQYKGVDFLKPAFDVLSNDACVNFLSSVMNSGQMNGNT